MSQQQRVKAFSEVVEELQPLLQGEVTGLLPTTWPHGDSILLRGCAVTGTHPLRYTLHIQHSSAYTVPSSEEHSKGILFSTCR